VASIVWLLPIIPRVGSAGYDVGGRLPNLTERKESAFVRRIGELDVRM